MFLGQFNNPSGCRLCWVRLFGIDSSAPSLSLSVPLLLSYIFPSLRLDGLRLGLGWEKCRVEGSGLKWGDGDGGEGKHSGSQETSGSSFSKLNSALSLGLHFPRAF